MKLRAVGQWLNLLLGSVLMLAVWVLLIWVGNRPALKQLIDLSPQQRSTIDDVTVDLLKGLAAQSTTVEFHLFFEPPGPEPQDVFQQQRVRILARLRELTEMLLRQYAFHGGESVKVENHAPYGDIARYREAAQQYGVTQTDVVVVAVRQSGRPPRYRTLSLEGDLGVVEIPQLQQRPGPSAQVPLLKDYKGEEALSSTLKSLLVQGTPTIYFLNGNSMDLAFTSGIGTGYQQLLQMLDHLGFAWRELDLRSGTVPKDAAVVVVLEPRREFADTETRALLDYVRHGGRLLLDYSWAGNPDWNIDGGEIGRQLGFRIGDRPVFHTIIDRYGPQVRGQDGSPMVSKLDLAMNPNHPITLRLARSGQVLQFDSARELEFRDPLPEGVHREELLQTGPQAWLAFPDANGQPDYRAPKAESAMHPRTLGAVFDVAGTPGPDGKKQDGIVVVLTGVFANVFGMAINGDLAANIFNWLSERRVLLDIRGSAYVSRHLQMVPQQLARIWWFLVVVVPALLLVGGLVVHWRRRDR